MSVVVGIIGLPCSGKSTVAEVLKRNGATVIDADVIAKDQLTDPLVIDQLSQLWGPSIVDANGQLLRASIADLVFAPNEQSRQRLRTLESIIHPRVHEEIQRRLNAATDLNASIVVLDVPLLLEVGWDRVCDEVWCIDVSPEMHAKMLAARGWNLEELQRRTANQLSIETKRSRAGRILTIDENVEKLQKTITDIIRSWPQRQGPQHCQGEGREAS